MKKWLLFFVIGVAVVLAVMGPSFYGRLYHRMMGSSGRRPPAAGRPTRVFVPRGDRYCHRKGCRRIGSRAAVPTPLQTARELCEPCPVCRPPR